MIPERGNQLDQDDHTSAVESALMLSDSSVINDVLQSESIDVSTSILLQNMYFHPVDA